PRPGSLSLSLDAAALEVMEALELLQQRREQLEQHLRQGWLSLAQARYSLGCHRVSSLQYGATMVPRVRVCHSRGGVTVRGGLGGPQKVPRLRQRRGAPERGGSPPRPPPDPLSWFGVLVPPSLRQAQGSFQKGSPNLRGHDPCDLPVPPGVPSVPRGDAGRGGGRAPGHHGGCGRPVPAAPAAEMSPGWGQRGQQGQPHPHGNSWGHPG
uniref:Vacuolar ATPase assembly protein VMA22 n=1 Tax=Catharus ustulatus TaxID=91951 RepID=A0A8C3UYE3_CATUS